MTNNNLYLEQQLQEIGKNLNRIRTAKGISLGQVAVKTRISQRLLEAIEAGDIQELPEPFYIQALVKKYAQEIGARGVKFEVTAKIDTEGNPNIKTKPPNPRKYWLNFQLRSLHLYLLYILLIVISVSCITTLIERPVIITQIPREDSVVDAPEETKSVTTSPPTELEPAPQFVSQSSNSESVTVGINLQERCWLKVMVDGKLAFEGILPKGTQRQWTGKQQVTIRAGNAGGVVISFNNEQQKVLGAPGQVEEITYTVN